MNCSAKWSFRSLSTGTRELRARRSSYRLAPFANPTSSWAGGAGAKRGIVCRAPSLTPIFYSMPSVIIPSNAQKASGFLPVEIYYAPSVRRSCGALKHRWVSKRTVELDKHLVGKNPLAGSIT
jgi:hypothetical protein